MKEKLIRNLLILAVIVSIIYLIGPYLIGTTGKIDENKQNSNTDNKLNVNINKSNSTNNFNTWFEISYTLISNDLNCVSDSAKSKNFSRVEVCGRFLKEDSNRNLVQMESYYNLILLRPLLTQYAQNLAYYKAGGENLESGAKNRNLAQMYNATKFIVIANNGMKDVMVNYSKLEYNNKTY